MNEPPRPPANPLETLVGYQMRRVSAAAMADLSRDLATVALTPTEASVLLLVAANPGIRPTELGRMLGIQRANMTPLTGKIEKQGLIRRCRVDGRSHGLTVTEQGGDRSVETKRIMDEHDRRLLEPLCGSARDSLALALDTLWGDRLEGS